MPGPAWAGAASRHVTHRLVVEGDLELQTPAYFGNGDSDDLTDMVLLVDSYDGRSALLTGATLAGALRGYLREREHGDRQPASITTRRRPWARVPAAEAAATATKPACAG